LGPDPRAESSTLQDHAAFAKADVVLKLKDQYLTAHGELRQQYRAKIEAMEGEIENLLMESESHSEGVINWRVRFAEVFLRKKGFDIVLANPPYVRMELILGIKPQLKMLYAQIYDGNADLYCYYYARGLQLLRQHGVLVFISSDKWLRANYGAKLRNYIGSGCRISTILDFGDLPVFQSAIAYPMILAAFKGEPAGPLQFVEIKELSYPYPDLRAMIQERGCLLPPTAVAGSAWKLEAPRTSPQTSVRPGIPLGEFAKDRMFYGVKTGLNKAFVIDANVRSFLLKNDPQSKNLIWPMVAGRGIQRWHANHDGKYLLYMEHDVDVQRLPTVLSHLETYRTELEGRATKQAWYELQQPQSRYAKAFHKPKILYQVFQVKPCFAFDNRGMMINNSVYAIASEDMYLLGVLNSHAFWGEIARHCSPIQGGYQLMLTYFEKCLIPDAASSERASIAKLTSSCVEKKGVNCTELETEINDRVSSLYGL
jgi:hypothetical protein